MRSKTAWMSQCHPEFEKAVKDYHLNVATVHHGNVLIVHELKPRFACSNPSNVYAVLKKLGLNTAKQPTPKSKKQYHIPVGKHRTQMDI